jgi:hypothetical protein
MEATEQLLVTEPMISAPLVALVVLHVATIRAVRRRKRPVAPAVSTRDAPTAPIVAAPVPISETVSSVPAEVPDRLIEPERIDKCDR